MTTEYSRQARIEDKGVIVSVQGNDNKEVHEQVMQLYKSVKDSLNEPILEGTIEEVNAMLAALENFLAAEGNQYQENN